MICDVDECKEDAKCLRIETIEKTKYSFTIITNLCKEHGTHLENGEQEPDFQHWTQINQMPLTA